MWSGVIIGMYMVSLLFLFLFSLGQLHLAWIYSRKKKSFAPVPAPTGFEPVVTIQLPVYNERYVVARLLNAVCALDYPREKLEIQILDDSTDDTTAIILERLQHLRAKQLDIKLLHRETRTGYKAGALDVGFQSARGEFIAIFDADFVPDPGFLKSTLPYFQHPRVGVVQTRWDHLNRNQSWLTRLQAFGLDAHFTIEQSARQAAGSFINFNGTCGIWRKACIADAGGWQSDTLTEDLDLSYRAQLRGWQFEYLDSVKTPGELPVEMPAIKSQQYRWNKGGAETARKMLAKVWAAGLPFVKKWHATFHLLNSTLFFFLLLAALLSVPVLFIKATYPGLSPLFHLGSIFLIGFFSIAWFYWLSTRQHPLQFIRLFPGFLIMSMGLALHNALAVVEGWVGRQTPFVRTPKWGQAETAEPITSEGGKIRVTPLTLLEGALATYFIWGVVLGFQLRDWGLLFFHVMLALGFGFVFFLSLKPVRYA
ncbi:MAG: glycosyltransferase [Cyclobacteriaceae bacterium]|nr:glycosyltransferase [Cyclobacteriaceae bacterium]